MGSLYVYITRIIPALSVIGVLTILLFALVIDPYRTSANGGRNGEATVSQLLVAAYTVFLHIMMLLFPARVCYAMGDVMQNMKETASIVDKPKKQKSQVAKKNAAANTYPSPLFVIILPAYKEDMNTLEETLRVLASHTQARRAYHIYLAMEEKEAGSDAKAANLINSFQNVFYKMSYTIHPFGIPGEAQGKSSNESWAAKQAFKDYPGAVKKDVVMTIMDADTHLSTRYFAQIAKYILDYPETNDQTIYVPPLVFDRNLHHVPLPVRTTDMMWAGAGLSSLYNNSEICIPTSVYSLPMTLAEHVGGWDTGPGAIGEDMHMYLKCFFALSGNLKVRIVYAAASQCNVSSDVKGFKGYVDGLQSRYKQALRHMWGSMDTGYSVRQAVKMVRRHYKASRPVTKGPSSVLELATYARDIALTAMSTVCTSNWADLYNGPGLHKSLISKPVESESASLKPINKQNVFVLFHRLFEAHFLPVHILLILSTLGIYEHIFGFLLPMELTLALNFSTTIRCIGWVLMVVYFYRYERYHRLCVSMRREEMRKAGLLEEVTEHDGFSPTVFQVFGFLEGGMFPLGGFVFGAIPGLQAVLSHLFTDRLVYHVSLKPQFIRKWRDNAATPSQKKQSQPKASHARCPSDTWRKQAISRFDSVTTALAFNRPVKRED